MQLTDALELQTKSVVALVGGGGKTTALFRLADELTARGKRVVTTTTTRIFAAQIQLAPRHLAITAMDPGLREVQAALCEAPHILLIGNTNQEGKAFGVEPVLVDRLIELDGVDVVIVEADGSRMRPFKAPAAHEPVVPRSTTVLVPVVGIDAIGKPLDDAHVHRAERVAQLAGVPLGTRLDPEIVVRVLAHPQGGLKNRPPHARVIPLVNKVESEIQRVMADEIAQRLLADPAIDAVALGAVRNPQTPVLARVARVAVVILAAGSSTRMQGATKQLLRWGDATLIRNAVEIAQASNASEIVVVTGNRAVEVEAQVQGTAARVVLNPEWASGRASSVRTGIDALDGKTGAAIFMNADQPFLAGAILDRLIASFESTLAPVVVPVYQGQPGSPVLFARTLFGVLRALQGDRGGREVLNEYRDVMQRVEIEDAHAALDLDTPAEYDAAVAQQVRMDDTRRA